MVTATSINRDSSTRRNAFSTCNLIKTEWDRLPFSVTENREIVEYFQHLWPHFTNSLESYRNLKQAYLSEINSNLEVSFI